MTKKKNGKIEILRFIVAVSILLFHLQKYMLGEASLEHGIHPAVFPHGSLGVEFFFLVSGYLMAASISRVAAKDAPGTARFVGAEGLQFVWKKYRALFPHHLVAFVLSFISLAILKSMTLREVILSLLDSVPSFFLLQMSGPVFTSPNHVEWYLSSMFIAMLILYPLMRRYYEPFTRYIGPLAAFLLLGYIIKTGEALTGVSVWMGFTFRGNLRALAEITLGASAFEVVQAMRRRTFTEGERTALTVLEVLAFLAVMVMYIYTIPKKYEYYGLAATFVLVVLAFSGITGGGSLFEKPFIGFLGRFSLYIYLAQVCAINLVCAWMAESSVKLQFAAGFVLTFLLAAVVMGLGDLLAAWLEKRRKPVVNG